MPETKLIGLIGPAEVITPFAGLGLKCLEAQDSNQAKQILNQLNLADYGVIAIAESLAQNLWPEIEKLKKQPLPAILILPEYRSQLKIGPQRLENILVKALGQKI